jgi:hypothetical protein
MRQIHRFEEDVSRNVIVVASSSTYVVLHGYTFEQVKVPEMVLKKQKNGIKTTMIKPCSQLSELVELQKMPRLTNEISCSFFINQNNGSITCLSFKSIQRDNDIHGHTIEVVYVRV